MHVPEEGVRKVLDSGFRDSYFGCRVKGLVYGVHGLGLGVYGSGDDTGTSLIRNAPLLGPCSRTIHMVLWWSWGGGLFLMSEVPLQITGGRKA